MKFNTLIFFLFSFLFAQAQNPLSIPPALTGTTFNLTVQSGSQMFFPGSSTPTYGINGVWMAPTIIVNKNDSITLNVINNLNVKTTMHWHGLHVAAMNDGGPHQLINPASTWSPSFKVRNQAGTFWYHPHGANQTEQQVGKGLAGLLIVKDNDEASLNLPRTYGIDDFPLILQSKAFDVLNQIAIATDMDTTLFVNGTLNPFLNPPAQVVRFRLLNASSLRSFNFGFSNNQTFYQIATDGGMLDSSIALTRLLLSPGERAEILVNFSGMQSQTVFLKSYASELPLGIYGADSVGAGADTIPEYADNFLNGTDFNLLQLNIVAPTTSPVTAVISSLIPYIPYATASATNYRTIVMDTIRLLPIDPPNRAEGPFALNDETFDMDSINETVYLNTTEIWTLINKTLIAHPFHIHDVQFNITEKSGLPPSPSENGWKDVVLVMPGDSVKFITKFTDFADPMTPYMYHCHLLHHEDDGMMGSFVVLDTNSVGFSENLFQSYVKVYPNPSVSGKINISLKNNLNNNLEVEVTSLLGQVFLKQKLKTINDSAIVDISGLQTGTYIIKIKTDSLAYTTKLICQ